MRIRPWSVVWLVVYLLVSAGVLVSNAFGPGLLPSVLLGLAMPPLIVFLVVARRQRDHLQGWLVAALAWSWLGDAAGLVVPTTLLVKLGLFALAHVCFVVAFWPYRRRSVLYRPVALVAYVVVVGGLLVWIAPHAGTLRWPIVGYSVLLLLMAVLASGVSVMTGIGGALFVLSDLSIAVFLFVAVRLAWREEVILSTYLPAQLLIVLGVLRVRGRWTYGRL